VVICHQKHGWAYGRTAVFTLAWFGLSGIYLANGVTFRHSRILIDPPPAHLMRRSPFIDKAYTDRLLHFEPDQRNRNYCQASRVMRSGDEELVGIYIRPRTRRHVRTGTGDVVDGIAFVLEKVHGELRRHLR